MGMFLNSIAPYEKYKAMASARYFVDKTRLLEELISGFGEETQYICITRPRRFGKTIMANMMGAFFGKAVSLGYVYRLANVSSRMLRATLDGDTATMAEILQYAHNTDIIL